MFDTLLPDKHNQIVERLLFELATWHALAKLRLHTETTVCDLEASTHRLGVQMRLFEKEVCPHYVTKELPNETAARGRRSSAQNAKSVPQKKAPTASKAKATAAAKNGPTAQAKLRKLNINTYKMHALGGYARAIRLHGTSDSYSSHIVSLSLHC